MSKKIGIVGSGIVGQTLANGFVRHGNDVMIATNTASKREELKSKTKGKAKIGSFEDAAKFGEVIVLATKGAAAEAALKAAGMPISKARPSSTPQIQSPMSLQYMASCSTSPRRTNRSWKGSRRSLPRLVS